MTVQSFFDHNILFLVVTIFAGGALAVRSLRRCGHCLFTPFSYDTYRYSLFTLFEGGAAAMTAWFVVSLFGVDFAWYLQNFISQVLADAHIDMTAVVTPYNLGLAGVIGGVSCLVVFFTGVSLGLVGHAGEAGEDIEEGLEDD